jgi:hypothetical protein
LVSLTNAQEEEGTRYRKFIHQRRQDNPNPIPRPRLTASQLDWQEWEAEQSLRLCISDPGYILWTQAKIDFLEELRECVMDECRAIYGQVFPEGHAKAGEDMPGNDCHPKGLTLLNGIVVTKANFRILWRVIKESFPLYLAIL